MNGKSVVTLKEFVSFVETKISLMNRGNQEFDVESMCKIDFAAEYYAGVENWYNEFILFYNLTGNSLR